MKDKLMANRILQFIIGLIFLSGEWAVSQPVAMDFSLDDCGGTNHHLFSELDAGKVVILDFVMLNCAPCIVATNALSEIVSGYEASHPGRVRIYSFGFLNSYTCEQMTAWKNSNNYEHSVFSGGEEQVAYYGGMGMPTIVVLGTNEHNVLFKTVGYSATLDDKIRTAIDSALQYSPTGTGDMPADESRFRAYPTFFSDRITVETPSHGTIELTDVLGRITGVYQVQDAEAACINTDNFLPGLYFLRWSDDHGREYVVKMFKK
ncbi:MAG TPA: T9SS type A sorting domain-containing protein [Bacteroidales bacterium]|nr:T9SS type A sorting domain-containing protein [Bacteroidales bacterium]